MDSLSKTLNNLSLYDVKHYVRKAQNAVLNLSDMEAKVREATNNEPWGASSSRMAEIARGTFNYKDREEICNMIFRRFTEKSAHEWRQIYKALQLMEYLVKHGSERFVDDARANVNLVSMLKSFHYIDSKGVDQGINVRNRARELSSLLGDEGRIRQERRKAKTNAKKFGGVSSNTYSSSSATGRPGHRSSFGDGDAYETRIFGDGGVYGRRLGDTAAEEHYTSYEAARNHTRHSSSAKVGRPTVKTTKTNASATSSAAPALDLVNFDEEQTAEYKVPESGLKTQVGSSSKKDDDDDFDDDFDDFQSAPTNTGGAPVKKEQDLADILASSYSTPAKSNSGSVSQPAQGSLPLFSEFNSTAQPQKSLPKKQDDIFGSLLASAKTTATSGRNSTGLNSSWQPAKNTKPAQAQPVAQQTQQSASGQSNGDSFDLLDL
ncbi:epsin n-terminal homology-containing protein [Brettanomyces bruxellensis AWRI1499]|nr:epsin n-terminal homology-containing protein [Brettanomyces bruxellensis AWRI1499]